MKVHFFNPILCSNGCDTEHIYKSLMGSAKLKLAVEKKFVILNNQISLMFKKNVRCIAKSYPYFFMACDVIHFASHDWLTVSRSLVYSLGLVFHVFVL